MTIDIQYHDPKVSVPIVFDDSSGGTGFFMEIPSGVWLLTARHLVLPTEFDFTDAFGRDYTFECSNGPYSSIEIYLRTDRSWSTSHIDLRCSSCTLISHPNLDLFAVQVEFDPRDDGYRVFDISDITGSLGQERCWSVFGYPRVSWSDPSPPEESCHLRDESSMPCEIRIRNPLDDRSSKPTIRRCNVGVDPEPAWPSDYHGLDGSPVLGEQLLGMHLGVPKPPRPSWFDPLDLDEGLPLIFLGSGLILQTLKEGSK